MAKIKKEGKIMKRFNAIVFSTSTILSAIPASHAYSAEFNNSELQSVSVARGNELDAFSSRNTLIDDLSMYTKLVNVYGGNNYESVYDGGDEGSILSMNEQEDNNFNFGGNSKNKIDPQKIGDLYIHFYLENTSEEQKNLSLELYMPTPKAYKDPETKEKITESLDFRVDGDKLERNLPQVDNNISIKYNLEQGQSSKDYTKSISISGQIRPHQVIDIKIPLKKLTPNNQNTGTRHTHEIKTKLRSPKPLRQNGDPFNLLLPKTVEFCVEDVIMRKSDLSGKYVATFRLDSPMSNRFELAPDWVQNLMPDQNKDLEGNISNDVKMYNFAFSHGALGPESEFLYRNGFYNNPYYTVDLTNIKKAIEGHGLSVYQNVKNGGLSEYPEGFWNEYIYTPTNNSAVIIDPTKSEEDPGRYVDTNGKIHVELHQVITTKDITINAGDKWDKYDNLISVNSPFNMKNLDKSVLKVEHNVDNKKSGVYKVKYIFTDEYTGEIVYKTATVTVKDKNNDVFIDNDSNPDITRIDGDDRIETAVKVSENNYPNGARAVIIANKDKYTDIMTAVPLSVQLKAPILFTNTDSIPKVTESEIKRLSPEKIYISGGVHSVSEKIEKKLSFDNYKTHRFNGYDRYDTARLIGEMVRQKGQKKKVEIASGQTFPDSLSISSLAVKDNDPILLTKKDSLTKITELTLDSWNISNITIAGGYDTVSKNVEKKLKNGFTLDKNIPEYYKGIVNNNFKVEKAESLNRIGGATRYETSAKIAEYVFPKTSLGVYTSGEKFADALVAGPFAANINSPVLLVKKDSLPKSISEYTKKAGIVKKVLVGGMDSISKYVETYLK